MSHIFVGSSSISEQHDEVVMKTLNTLMRGMTVRVSAVVLTLFSLGTIDIMIEDRLRANPSGGVVKHGSVQINPTDSSGLMQINQTSQKSVVEWNNFSINANQHVNFNMPHSNSSSLNRVVGNQLSNIAGKLSSNGQIILVNPNGIVFANGAVVDTAGLIASTLNLANQNYLDGNLKFLQLANRAYASIINNGNLTVSNGGALALISPYVENHGLLVANLGTVAIGSGTEVTIDFAGDELLSFVVNKPTNALDLEGNEQTIGVNNQGEISSDGGQVILVADTASDILRNTINLDGVVHANTIESNNGYITLSAGDDGTADIRGQLLAKSDVGTGGKVEVTGGGVGLFDEGVIDVSGATGGGEVLFGGDYQGLGEHRQC